MSERDQNREWLQREGERYPDGWSARFVEAFGIEGALNLLEVQGGDPFAADLSRRPFARNEELKAVVRDARTAVTAMTRAAYLAGWEKTKDEGN